MSVAVQLVPSCAARVIIFPPHSTSKSFDSCRGVAGISLRCARCTVCGEISRGAGP